MTEDAIALSREFGELLRYARNANELTLGQLSELTGDTLPKSRICTCERGTRRIGIDVARILAHAPGNVSPAYLMYLVYLDDRINLGAEEIDLIKTYRRSDAKGRALVRQKTDKEPKGAAKGAEG